MEIRIKYNFKKDSIFKTEDALTIACYNYKMLRDKLYDAQINNEKIKKFITSVYCNNKRLSITLEECYNSTKHYDLIEISEE